MSEQTQSTKRKARRKLSDFDFSSQDAHIALVSRSQGGPANERTTLVMKATKFTEEEIEKMQQIRVTMELPDFLQKFFHMYYEDSYVLAKLMGYTEPESEDDDVDSYEDYIESRLEAFEIIKSLHESNDLPSVISELGAEDYLGLLRDQQRLEKAFKKESAEATEVAKAESSTEVNSEVGADTKDDVKTDVQKATIKSGDFVSWNSSGGKAYGKVTSIKTSGSIKVNENVSINADSDNPAALITLYKKNAGGGWEPTDTKVAHKTSTLTKIAALKKATLNNETKVDLEDNMTEKTQETAVAEFEVEVVEKSAVEALQKQAAQEKETLEKALTAQKEELQKALELVAKFEEEKKEAVTKARFAQVKDAVKDEAKAEVLFKAVNLVEDSAEFEAVVKALKDMADLAEQGELFVEKGVSVEGEGTEAKQESAVAKLLKAKAAK